MTIRTLIEGQNLAPWNSIGSLTASREGISSKDQNYRLACESGCFVPDMFLEVAPLEEEGVRVTLVSCDGDPDEIQRGLLREGYWTERSELLQTRQDVFSVVLDLPVEPVGESLREVASQVLDGYVDSLDDVRVIEERTIGGQPLKQTFLAKLNPFGVRNFLFDIDYCTEGLSDGSEKWLLHNLHPPVSHCIDGEVLNRVPLPAHTQVVQEL